MFLLSDLLTELIKFIVSDLPTTFFDNSFIKSLLDFFQWLGVIIFAIATLLMLTSVAEKRSAGEFINFGMTVRGFLQAAFLLFFARPVPILIFQLSQDIAFALVATVAKQADAAAPTIDWKGFSSLFSADFWSSVANFFTKHITAIGPQTIVFFILLFFSITMTIQLLRIFAILVVQIINGYFSIVDTMLGDSNAFYVWFQDVLANCLTFALEYVFYVAGVAVVNANSYNGLGPCAPGLALIAGASAVPAALKRLGFNHGGPSVAGSIAAVGRTAATIMMVGSGGGGGNGGDSDGGSGK